MSTTPVEKAVCADIQSIMCEYRKQLRQRGYIDSPGGFEHMGDVWRWFQKWDEAIEDSKAPFADCCRASRCHVCGETIPNIDKAWETTDSNGKHRVCAKCFEDFAQAMNDSAPRD